MTFFGYLASHATEAPHAAQLTVLVNQRHVKIKKGTFSESTSSGDSVDD